MSNSFLIKSTLHNTIAEGIYNEIVQQQSKYYYFLGKTLTWGDDLGTVISDEITPPLPVDSYKYELETRKEIITMKRVTPSDVCFVVPRIDWKTNTVFDMYDDSYSNEVIGVDLVSGGDEYTAAPLVYIGSTGSIPWVANTTLTQGSLIYYNDLYYIVSEGGNTTSTPPTHTSGTVANGTCSLKWVSINTGNGSGATATATVYDLKVVSIDVTSAGSGYTFPPSIIITDGNSTPASANVKIGISSTGKNNIEDSKFYVLTNDNSIYVCLDNNKGAASTVMPTGTSVEPFSTADGYVWKFLYIIPISLRNKFLTETYIPVTTSLRDQFYSNGNIQRVIVNSSGSGYTSAYIAVSGNGYLEKDPIYISSVNFVSGGSGYTSNPTVTIEPPVTSASSWSANSVALVGQYLNHNGNIYRVDISGVTSASGPTHKVGTVSNGTAGLSYVGCTAVATATRTGSLVTGVTFQGNLKFIDVTNGGSGYTSAPTVNISSGTATAVAVLQNGSVNYVQVTSSGSGYTSAPTITFGKVWTSSTAQTLNSQIYYANRLYTVTVAGTTNAVVPTHTSGTATNGTCTLKYVGVPATATSSLKYGEGYSTTPKITFTSGGGSGASAIINTVKSEARLYPIISSDTMGSLWTANTAYTYGSYVYYGNNLYYVIAAGTSSTTPPTHTSGFTSDGNLILQYSSSFGNIVGVNIADGGVGYSYSTITIDGDGTGASLSADLGIGNIDTQQSNIELLTVSGAISAIPVISGGYGYGDGSTTISIVGDGVGATATPVTDNGRITKINMVNLGRGYTWATVTINGAETAFGAKARAIIAPYGGMGKNAINNLYSRTLMFYTNISGDKNQGFSINNDYRQLGVIKNPYKYGATSILSNSLASPCWVISTTSNVVDFPLDALLNMNNDDNSKFRIVANTGSSMLLQSLDNKIPQITSTFTNRTNNLLVTANAVTPPNVDKYSGDLLFIDNRQAFTPTADQTVTMRTVIRF